MLTAGAPRTVAATPAVAATPDAWEWSAITSGEMFSCATLPTEIGKSFYCVSSDPQKSPIIEGRMSADVYSSIHAGYKHLCGIRTVDSQLECFGEFYGDFFRPTYPGPWLTAGIGILSICGIKVGGSLWCWGSNEYGQLGGGVFERPGEPMRIGDAAWSSISVGRQHACGIQIDGSLWCWGDAEYGAIGDGSSGNLATRSTPTRIGVDSWRMISSGQESTCGIKEDNTLWCWGSTNYGRLGIGAFTTSLKATPQPVEGLWRSVAVGGNHACGLKDDSTLWCWGGGAGISGLITEPGWHWDSFWDSPHQIGNQPYLQVSVGDDTVLNGGHTCLLLIDHSVSCRGTFNTVYKDLDVYGIKFAQEFSHTPVENKFITDEDFELDVVASSGLAVTTEVLTPDLCSLSGAVVNVLGKGRCRIAVDQAGNEKYLPAETLEINFWISANAQEILFGELSARSILDGPFTLQGTSSAGLPVSYESLTPSTCSVAGGNLTMIDVGTCTIRASQEGDETYAPADSVVQSFLINRALIANKVVTFVDPDNIPIAGLRVTWQTLDGKYKSSVTGTTNAAGQIKYQTMPGGNVRFSVSGTVGRWSGAATHVVSVGRVSARVVTGVSSSGSGLSRLVVHARMQDGTAVPGASVSLLGRYGFSNAGARKPPPGQFCKVAGWALDECTLSAVTNSNGDASFVVVSNTLGERTCVYRTRCNDPYDYASAIFTDGEMSVTSELTPFVDGQATVEMEQLPVVEFLPEPATVNFGAPQIMTAIALNSDGSPIAGRSLTLSASTSGASASCSGRKTTATTNSAGRATFKVCPVKTATWSVDGRSIVGSAGVRLTVQLTPTAPRTLVATAKTRSVSLAWAAPVKANASTVTDYIVQYRLQVSSTWITFRDGTSTSRKATVTGLTKGRVYEFRIAAKNRSGTGTWSVVVLRAAK